MASRHHRPAIIIQPVGRIRETVVSEEWHLTYLWDDPHTLTDKHWRNSDDDAIDQRRAVCACWSVKERGQDTGSAFYHHTSE